MKATVLLRQQHKQVRDLFKKVENTESADMRRRLLEPTGRLERGNFVETPGEELACPVERMGGQNRVPAALPASARLVEPVTSVANPSRGAACMMSSAIPSASRPRSSMRRIAATKSRRASA